MRRSVLFALCGLVTSGVTTATAATDSTVVAFRGRFAAVVNVDETHSPFPWNHNSRSPDNRSRLMGDLLVGRGRFGELYVKGAASWGETDDVQGRVNFVLEQGDYLWRRRAGHHRFSLRAFANERRFFTHEMSAPLLDDDRASRYDDRWGLRGYGDVRGSLRWDYLGAALDDDDVRPRLIHHARAGYFARYVQASLGYLYDRAAREAPDRSVIKGEVSAFYRRATAIVSYAQSGLDQALPSGSFDWGHWVGNNYTEMAPDNSATFAEFRLTNIPARESGRLDFSYRYSAIGRAFVNDLAPGAPGEVRNVAGLYWSHRSRGVDARVVYEKHVRYEYIDAQTENVYASARAFFRDGSEAFVRGGFGSRDDGFVLADDYFAHAALRRAERRYDAAVHAMVSDLGNGVRDRYAAEVRVRAGGTTALYWRYVLDDNGGSHPTATVVRIEFRPTRRIFATVGYGRTDVGDGPFLLEDRDINLATDPTDMYTFTVRADF